MSNIIQKKNAWNFNLESKTKKKTKQLYNTNEIEHLRF